MNPRMRRLAKDYEQVVKDFQNHQYITVQANDPANPEEYRVTYNIKGISLLPDGRIQEVYRHDVIIVFPMEYPRYKPICRILTPIWHPNFKDGQICIGDIWGAGETLTDIIINIGDMIQYKSWNSFSPLNADAAKWAIEVKEQNENFFPVGDAVLHITDYASAADSVDIDLVDEEGTSEEEASKEEAAFEPVNDFDITAEELEGIEYVPTSERMQKVPHGGTVKGGKINFKTILTKGLLWALIGSLFGFCFSELADGFTDNAAVANMMGHSYLSEYFEYNEKADEVFNEAYEEYEVYCDKNGINAETDEDAFSDWLENHASTGAKNKLTDYLEYDEKAETALYNAYQYEFASNETSLEKGIVNVVRMQTALWAAIIALFIGLFLGIGEGVFYGSKEQAVRYALIGAGISIAIGLFSGYIAQWMYSEMLGDDPADFAAAVVRGLGWAIMGLGVGIAVGFIKPEKKRIIYCALGGLGGGFLGGFLFNYVCDIIPNDVVARGVAIVVMGLLIGLGVGLLEQFAKQAWLKVIRGEFEGKEYLVFAGVTSIGNDGKNTIVLFKDKLVGSHHCDIILEGSRYMIVDCGTPMGTVVNGNRIARHQLRQGDAIAIGNSVLVFNTK